MSALSVPLFCTDLDPPVPEQQELVPEDQILDDLPSQRIHEHPRRNPVDGSLLDKIGQFPDSQPAPHCFGQQFLLQNQPPLLGRVQPEQDGHGNETREEAA